MSVEHGALNGSTCTTKKVRPRLEYLDALRGLGVLGVLVVHTHQNFTTDVGARVLALGMYGVQLFYIVSAFSLCLSMHYRSTQEESPIRNYAIRRLLRIAPAFYLAVAFYFVRPFITPEWTLPREVNPPPWAPGVPDLLLTLSFLNGWSYRAINLIVPGGWSVAVETNFYLVLPLLFRYARNVKRVLVLLVGSVFAGRLLTKLFYVLVVPHIQGQTANAVGVFVALWLPTQLPVFVIGILWFALHRAREGQLGFVSSSRRSWLAAALLGAVGLAALPSQLLERILPFHIRICFVLLFGCMLLAERPTKVLVNRATVYLGKISYSAYLFHMVVLQLLLWLSGSYFEPRFGGRPGFYAVFPLVVILSCMLSHLTYRWIEVPGQELGRRLILRWEKRKV